MAGTLVIHTPNVSYGFFKFKVFIDGKKVATGGRNEILTIAVERDCELRVAIGINPKSNALAIPNDTYTELTFKVPSSTYKCVPQIIKQTSAVATGSSETELFRGIVIESAEVGTNLLGWVRGVDRNSSTTPVSAKFTFVNKTGKAIKYLTVAYT